MTPPTGPARTNSVRTRLSEKQVAVVAAGHSGTADTADFLGSLGVHGVWLEGEHGAVTWERIPDISRACELWGMAAMYRVQTLEPSLVARALTLGVHGVVVPQVRTAKEAELLVQAAKFAPLGRRGVSRGRRSYQRPEFLARENDTTVLVVQIEDPEGLRNIEEIAAVPGIDVVFVAPNDLAQALGRQGRLDHPDVVAAVDDGLARIAASGTVAAGTLCAPGQERRFLELGVRFLYVSYDPWLQEGARAFHQRLQAARSSEPVESAT